MGDNTRVLTADEIHTAEQLLADGASFGEVGRTLHRNKSVICRHFPGRGWTEQQKSEAAALQRRYRGVL